MGGMKVIIKKKEKIKFVNIIFNLLVLQIKYLGIELFVQLVICVNNRNFVW